MKGATSLEASPLWVREDAKQYLANPDGFERAAAMVIASAAGGPARKTDNESFVRLPADIAPLSRHGAAWCRPGYEGHPDLVYFDNGPSDYPVADGLVYSSSPTLPPTYNVIDSDVPNSVLSTPTAVAPHWWVAAWDPLLFYNGISYDGRDYSRMGRALTADPHNLRGATTTVSGSSVGGVTFEDGSDVDINFVDVGSDKPVPVLTNPFTRDHKPKAAHWFVYRIRVAVLRGGREIAFALDAWE